jgi:hypothetical protein
MANYAQAMEMAKSLLRSGGLPPGVTVGMMAQQIMGGAEAMPERGGMPPMTTGLLESVRAGAQTPVQADPIAAETAARQARAAQAGGVSPEMEALYAAREARLGAEEERIGKDEKRAAWDALAQMGFKMAQTTSPYFATALAEGMQAGTTGYNAAKIEAAERKAKVLDGKENVALARLKERQAKIDANEEAFRGDVELAGKRVALAGRGEEAKLNAIKLKYADTMAKLGVEAAEAELLKDAASLKLTQAQTDQVREETRLAPVRAANAGGGGGAGGSTRGVSATALFEAQQTAMKAMEELAPAVNEAKKQYDEIAKKEGFKSESARDAFVTYTRAKQIYDSAKLRYNQARTGGGASAVPSAIGGSLPPPGAVTRVTK